MWRQITGKINRTNDDAWRNINVVFRRFSNSYTESTQYPADSIKCKVDENGYLVNCKLWVNETGNLISNYKCFLPCGDSFTFSIPEGDGSSIDLSILRFGSNPIEEYPQTLVNYIDNQISLHNLDTNSHPNLDGGTGRIKTSFGFGDATPKTITTLPVNTTVLTSQIIITEVFDGANPSLQLGDSTYIDRFLNIPSEGLTNLFEFETNVTHTYTSETGIILTITPGAGASSGKGFVIIEI